MWSRAEATKKAPQFEGNTDTMHVTWSRPTSTDFGMNAGSGLCARRLFVAHAGGDGEDLSINRNKGTLGKYAHTHTHTCYWKSTVAWHGENKLNTQFVRALFREAGNFVVCLLPLWLT